MVRFISSLDRRQRVSFALPILQTAAFAPNEPRSTSRSLAPARLGSTPHMLAQPNKCLTINGRYRESSIPIARFIASRSTIRGGTELYVSSTTGGVVLVATQKTTGAETILEASCTGFIQPPCVIHEWAWGAG